jgi:EpsD family peptidyl-prolyl cis-trans isomerase
MSFTKSVLIIVVVAVAVFASSCSQEKKIEVSRDLAARVNDAKIERKYVDDMYEVMTPGQKNKYKGKEGRAKFVDMLIDEELLYQAALEVGLKNNSEVKERLKQAERNVLLAAYYDKVVRQMVEISEAEIEAFYEEHFGRYMNSAIIKAQHIFSTDSMKVVDWKKRIESGTNFSSLAKAESEDETTASRNGNIGVFNYPGGYTEFYGDDEVFFKQIGHLEEGEVSDIVVTDKGYSLIKINSKIPESLKPLADVRDAIINELRNVKAKTYYEDELTRLRGEANVVNYLREEFLKVTRTPEELWNIAQEEDAAYTRILYYRTLIERYPDHEYAPQALFMIGFVYAEELQLLSDAERTFQELLHEYPDAEVAESARWMLKNLDTAHPRFESIDDMKARMEKDTED